MANGQNFGSLLFRQVTGLGSTSGGTETTLSTFTIPANTTITPGDVIRIRAWGTGANNANSKTLKVYLGATSMSFSVPASIAAKWCLDIDFVYITASSEAGIGTMITTNASGSNDCQTSSPTEDMTTNVITKITGTGTTSADLVMTGVIIEKLS